MLFSNTKVFSQYFEGKIEYQFEYLDNNTHIPMFELKFATEYIKNGKLKRDYHDAKDGALMWQIYDYENNSTYLKYSEHSTDVPIYDKSQVIVKDGKVTFGKPLVNYKTPLQKDIVCFGDSTKYKFDIADTIYNINGYKTKSAVHWIDNNQYTVYFFCDSIKINPKLYNCNRVDGLDKLYKFTNGSLIVKTVTKIDLYTYVEQIAKIEEQVVDDSIFTIPKDLEIVEIKR